MDELAAEQLISAVMADDVDALSELVPDVVGPEEIVEQFANRSLIIVCAIAGATKSIRYLLDLGASVEGRALDGQTALMSASESVRAARLLLKEGADPNAESVADGGTLTPLWSCMYNPAKNTRVFRVLLEAGADPFAVNARGVSPAEYATGKFRTELDDFLKTQGS